jgi:type II secretion system protein G
MRKAIGRAQSKAKAGFTLIEMLIVIVILGILAMVIIPQIGTSTDDAKLSTLQTNLSAMRNAVELYYAQHNATYPGANLGGALSASAAFIQQLTRYTAVDGTIATVKDATHKYGPYIKGDVLPLNPFNELRDVTIDAVENDITARASGSTTGWKFYSITGVFMADDGSHDTE